MFFWKKKIEKSVKIETPPIVLIQSKEIKVIEEIASERKEIKFYVVYIKGTPDYTFYFLDEEKSKKLFNSLSTLKKQNFIYSHTGPGAAIKQDYYDKYTYFIKQTKSKLCDYCIFKNAMQSVSLNSHSYFEDAIITIRLNTSKEYFDEKIKQHNLDISKYVNDYYNSSEDTRKKDEFLKDTNMSFKTLMRISAAIRDKNIIIWEKN